MLQGIYPFAIVRQGGVDAAVAFGGAGDALVGWEDVTGGVAGVAHGAVGDGLSCFVYGGAIHVQGEEEAFPEEAGVGLVGGAFDDECQEAETGIAVLEPSAWREVGAVFFGEVSEDVCVEELGGLGGRDQGLIIEDTGGMC